VSAGVGGAAFLDPVERVASAPFPVESLPRLAHAMDVAAARVAVRRAFVAQARPLLAATGLGVETLRPGDEPSWHRLPVWAEDRGARERLLASCWAAGVPAQAPHGLTSDARPPFAASRRVGNQQAAARDRLVLLRTEGHDAIGRLREALAPR
jgi:hypothetical protein